MNAVDTNVLIYAHDPRDLAKQNKAVTLIAGLTDGVLLWQVACEYLAASRKLAVFGMSQPQAFATLHRLRGVWQTALPTWTVMDKAETLMTTGNLSLWDALIVAACQENGVKRLYSEDFDASTTTLTGIEIINPFL
jgi:predicted nucleic acid-binding protein